MTGRGKQRHLIDNPPKAEETVYKEWVCDDVKSVLMLWNSMESYIMDPVTHLDRTKEMWENLNLLYCGKVTSRILKVCIMSFSKFNNKGGE